MSLRLTTRIRDPYPNHDEHNRNRLHQDTQAHQLVAIATVEVTAPCKGQHTEQKNEARSDDGSDNEKIDHSWSDLSYKNAASNATSLHHIWTGIFMEATRDVVIIGGGVIGSAIAYFLKASPGFSGTVTVIEKDPSYEFGSTARSWGGVRQQFSVRIGFVRHRPELIDLKQFTFIPRTDLIEEKRPSELRVDE